MCSIHSCREGKRVLVKLYCSLLLMSFVFSQMSLYTPKIVIESILAATMTSMRVNADVL